MLNSELLLDFGDICGYVAGVLTVLSLVPQIVTMIRTKNPEGISLLMIIALWIVSVLNLVYGIIIHSFPLVLTNIFTIILWTVILTLWFYYTKKYRHWDKIPNDTTGDSIYGAVTLTPIISV